MNSIAVDFTNQTVNFTNIDTTKETDLPLFQGLIKTQYWPLNYTPFLAQQPGDLPTTVDLTTMIWYVNSNPKRLN